jgi:quinol monooxygenase YgiN
MDAIAIDPNAATLINVLTCDPTGQSKLLELLRENIDNIIVTLDGWRSTTLVAAPDGVRVIIISQWRDATAITSMQNDARMQSYFPKIAALSAFDSTAGTISYARQARRKD